jgi:hypothetical protein
MGVLPKSILGTNFVLIPVLFSGVELQWRPPQSISVLSRYSLSCFTRGEIALASPRDVHIEEKIHCLLCYIAQFSCAVGIRPITSPPPAPQKHSSAVSV